MEKIDIITIIFLIIGSIMTSIGKIWAIVSFIVYLIKDISFDWNSVIVFGIGIVITIISYVVFLQKN